MKTFRLNTLLSLLTMFVVFPLLTHGAGEPPVGGPIFQNVGDVQTRLESVLGILYTAAITVGVIYVVIAAFRYMTSNGSSEVVGKANKALMYAAIGIAIALIAKGIPIIIETFLRTGK